MSVVSIIECPQHAGRLGTVEFRGNQREQGRIVMDLEDGKGERWVARDWPTCPECDGPLGYYEPSALFEK